MTLVPAITAPYILIDERGVARIADSRVKVIHLVMEKMANGWDPDQMQRQFPHLSLAQIHAAFSYYYDHRPELDEQILETLREVDRQRAAAGASPVAEGLRKSGKLR